MLAERGAQVKFILIGGGFHPTSSYRRGVAGEGRQ